MEFFLDNASFLFACAGLNYVFEVLWEVSRIVETYTNALEKMSDSITASMISTDSLNESPFRTFSDVVNQVFERGKFENCAILHNKFHFK